jgi:hypothetical protein
MQLPIYRGEEEQKLMTELWSPAVADDLEAFVMYAFPWGVKNTPLARFTGPRKWQREVLRDVTEHIKAQQGKVNFDTIRAAVSSGRGIGKSALVSWLVLWMLTTRIGGSVVVSANSENQLRSVTWAELTKWSAMLINSHWWEISATKLVPAKWLTDIVEKDLKKGTRYWACEGKLWSEENPDSYAGVHNQDGMMLIFDESSGIPDAIWDVGAGFFTENTPDRYWFAFSNPRRNSGYFFECFNAKRAFWKSRVVDARTVEDTDKAVYEQIIAEYGENSSQAKIEVYGEFPSAGEDQFIGPTLVDDAMKRPKYKDMTAPIIVGVDPARGGADATVIVVRQGRDLVAIKRYQGEDTMTIVGRVIEAIEEYKPTLTVIDVRGINFGNKAKHPIAFGNKRAEMWNDMRNWLKSASIPTDRQLRADLTGPAKRPDSSGTIFLEGKKEMRARGLASPDAADALCVTFAFPVAHREYTEPTRRYNAQDGAMHTSWMGS